ncbi:MAG: NADH-quinone oxidoreductase subunit C [Alphaproteobacteria bacterium]
MNTPTPPTATPAKPATSAEAPKPAAPAQPKAAPVHYDTYIDAASLTVLDEHIRAILPDDVLTSRIAHKELTMTVRRSRIVHVLTTLRDDARCQFKQLMDVCGVDWLGQEGADTPERFDVVYHVLSPAKNMRVRLKVHVAEGDTVPSVVSVFNAANWFERETFDMFGIRFENHPDLRRILTDYGFDGHPLRKDFPLSGFVETYYDAKEERVAYKPVDLPQAFRHFDHVSAWRGMTGNSTLAEQDNRFDAGEFKA